jgi:Na+/melibiose symporter-like transporter
LAALQQHKQEQLQQQQQQQQLRYILLCPSLLKTAFAVFALTRLDTMNFAVIATFVGIFATRTMLCVVEIVGTLSVLTTSVVTDTVGLLMNTPFPAAAVGDTGDWVDGP